MRKRTATAVAATVMLLGGCATPYMKARAKEQDRAEKTARDLYGARYVAMGSSYAAGPMLPPAKPGAPARCGQSMSNYPTLLAEQYRMVLVDVSCSGAKTEHILGPWGDIAPQIDAVKPDTQLVTVTIGGNNLNYVGDLFVSSCLQAAAMAPAGAKPAKCGALVIPTENDYLKLRADMDAIAKQVHKRSPKARLVFVQYLTPLGDKLCAVTPIRPQDAEPIREIGRRLAEITSEVAQHNGAMVVEMNRQSASHTPCDPVPWMIGFPKGYDGSQGLQWHLNKAGMKATAEGIAYWLINGKAPVVPPAEAAPAAPVDSASPKTATPPESTPTPTPEAKPTPEAMPGTNPSAPGDADKDAGAT